MRHRHPSRTGYARASATLTAVVLLFATCTLAVSADGNMFYVAPGGSGTLCTPGQPCALDTAIGQAQGGDTLIMAGGTYTATGPSVASISQSITLLGGWDGGASVPCQLAPQAIETLIDGEGARRGLSAEGPIDLTLDGLTIANGTHPERGAGLHTTDVNVTMVGVTLLDNEIPTDVADYAYGGGALIEGGAATLTDCVMRGNIVHSLRQPHGGGVAISNTVAATVTGCLFDDNYGWQAGGLFVTGRGRDSTPLRIEGNRFVGNRGGYNAALIAVDVDAVIRSNWFEGNRASNRNGAALVSDASLVMDGNTFLGNESNWMSASRLSDVQPMTVTNNVWVENASRMHDRRASGPLQIDDCEGILAHNTLARNPGRYGIQLDEGAAVILTNNIVVSHTMGISVASGCSATLAGTLWGAGPWANGSDIGGEGTITLDAGNFQATPGFVNHGAGDYHLAHGSAAIDAGVASDVTTDIDGDARPYGAGHDIGADEVASAPPTAIVRVPLVLRSAN